MSEPIPVPQIGLRVRVTSVPLRGGASVVDERGTIDRFEPLDLWWAGQGIHDVPVIRLDSGRELRGWECWWTTVDDARAVKRALEAPQP
jgi:hypothetical protein